MASTTGQSPAATTDNGSISVLAGSTNGSAPRVTGNGGMRTPPATSVNPQQQQQANGSGVSGASPTPMSFANASLYVGDLQEDVFEPHLYDVFNGVGPVASIRVCRDSVTRRSLGYAYVNYHSPEDAERALETLNFSQIQGKPCRIMWSQRDPSLRKSGTGNLFVKNLDKSINQRMLYDTFSIFGNILSCKVASDHKAESRGYGFVHYESEESGLLAIDRVNNMKIGTKAVYVGPFRRRAERSDEPVSKFTNIYVKSIPEEWSEEILKTIFSEFGEVTSYTISTDSKSRRFGFVNFALPEEAAEAVEKLNGRATTPTGVAEYDEFDDAIADHENEQAEKEEDESPSVSGDNENGAGDESSTTTDKNDEKGSKKSKSPTNSINRLYVSRHQPKAERVASLRARFSGELSAQTSAQNNRYQGVNVYVKNLDDSVDDEKLEEAFSPFGSISSAKVMRDEKDQSRGFGFVCFSSPDEGTKAITEMHLKMLHGKPLYVCIAEKKEQRVARLQQRYPGGSAVTPRLVPMGPMHHQTGMRAGGTMGGGYGPTSPYGMGGAGGAMGGYGGGANSMPFSHPNMMYNPAAPQRMPNPGMYTQQNMMGGSGNWRMQGGGSSVGGPRNHHFMHMNVSNGMHGGASGGLKNNAGMHNSFPSQQQHLGMGRVRPGGGGYMPQQNRYGQQQGGGYGNNAGQQGGGGMGGGAMARPNGNPSWRFTPQVRNRQDAGAGMDSVPTTASINPAQMGGHMHGAADMHLMGGPGFMSHQPENRMINSYNPHPLSGVQGGQMDISNLASYSTEIQKRILGERLFPLIAKNQPRLAGKITGMMLEMENPELIMLLESDEQLDAKIEEALRVLEQAQNGSGLPQNAAAANPILQDA